MELIKKYYRYAVIVIGAGAGYAYYYYVGCASGSCPIQSNPYISTIYGAVMAGILVLPTKKKGGRIESN